MRLPDAPAAEAQASGSLTPTYWAFWTLLMITVATEFSVAVWGPSYLETVLGLSRSSAVLAVAAFPLGMVTGRFGGLALLHRFKPHTLVVPSIGIAFLGFMLFWQGGNAWTGLAGLFVTGLGLANLYPLGMTLRDLCGRLRHISGDGPHLARLGHRHHRRAAGPGRNGGPLRDRARLWAGAVLPGRGRGCVPGRARINAAGRRAALSGVKQQAARAGPQPERAYITLSPGMIVIRVA